MRSMSTSKKKSRQKAPASRRPRAKAPVKPPLVRGEVVVQRVLDAAIHELAQVGYRGFRIEEVAARAEVNKTTVYRRWPTKSELVRDALEATSDRMRVIPNTGSLRSDLLAFGRVFVERATNPLGKSVVRMLAAEGSAPEVIDIVRSLRDRGESASRVVIANALARGELAPGADHMVLFYALIGALHHRIIFMNEEADEAFLAALIDTLLLGVLHPGARPLTPRPQADPGADTPRPARSR